MPVSTPSPLSVADVACQHEDRRKAIGYGSTSAFQGTDVRLFAIGTLP
jgi:hypothetical protein